LTRATAALGFDQFGDGALAGPQHFVVLAWVVLHFGGMASEPNAVGSLVAASIVTFLVYGWLKFRQG
jgi:hypothetical protein